MLQLGKNYLSLEILKVYNFMKTINAEMLSDFVVNYFIHLIVIKNYVFFGIIFAANSAVSNQD